MQERLLGRGIVGCILASRLTRERFGGTSIKNIAGYRLLLDHTLRFNSSVSRI